MGDLSLGQGRNEDGAVFPKQKGRQRAETGRLHLKRREARLLAPYQTERRTWLASRESGSSKLMMPEIPAETVARDWGMLGVGGGCVACGLRLLL